MRIFMLLVMLCTLFASAEASASTEMSGIKLGIDRIDEYRHIFDGKRVGLITNQTGVNAKLVSTIDILNDTTTLTALFSPEHGIRGAISAGMGVGSGIDQQTHLPVFSLYGATKKPTAEMLKNVDVLCFDMQDIGVRTYTYIYTMAYALQACAEFDKDFVVFDRPNPLGGEIIEGPVLKAGYESFIGMYQLPMRYGLTVGELARLINTEYHINARLTVIPMQGWQRSMVWQDTGLHWVMTSPNIPSPESALLYCGTGIIGPTNLSEGVGTTKPFELIGAAWINGYELQKTLNNYNLPGVYFRLTSFIPQFGNLKGIPCEGIQLHVTDIRMFRPVQTAAIVLHTINELFPGHLSTQEEEFGHELGEANFLHHNESSLQILFSKWSREAGEFKKLSGKYYLY